MLDLVLAWGDLDGALGMTLSVLRCMDMVDGARRHGKWGAVKKIREIQKELRERSPHLKIVRIFEILERQYEQHSFPRNRIGHSKYIGVLGSDSDYMVFAKYEAYGDSGLSVDYVPLQVMREATRWANRSTKHLLLYIGMRDPSGI